MTSPAAAAAAAVTAPGSRFDLLPVVRGLGLVVVSMLGLVLLLVAARRLSGARQLRRREELTRQVRPLLLEVLADDDPDPDAVQRLARLGRSQWRAAEQTRSRSLITRCRAAEMLGAARRVEYVPTLTRLLEDPQPEVRRVAIRSLGRIGSADAVEPLLHSVSGDPPTSSMDVSAALVLLAPDATAVLARIARESTSDVERSVAAEVLGLRGAVVSAPTLIAMLQDSDSPEVRIRAARALGRIGDPRAAEGLTEAPPRPTSPAPGSVW